MVHCKYQPKLKTILQKVRVVGKILVDIFVNQKPIRNPKKSWEIISTSKYYS